MKVPDVAPIESIQTRLQIQDANGKDSGSDQSGSSSTSSSTSQGQSRYFAIVQERINQQWTAPPVQADEDQLQVVLKFRILRTGKIIDIDVEQGSGNSFYDDSALRAVQAANPLPPFPSEIRSFSLDVQYNFIFGESAS